MNTGIEQESRGALQAAISEWHRVRGEIAPEDEERLWKKLRLEWNYNSNHIEGNTLTYDETVLLLIHGQTAGSHPLRDYEEMKAHDVAIELVRNLSSAEQPLTEADIRELNRVLLKEPFWKLAETPDGATTRKRIIPGGYKTHPNHVRTRTGELHRFAEPEETPARMEEWVHRFRSDLARADCPLPEFLAESHWSFVNIHPFDDGNGRTARLITNYILLRKNLLPIVIKSADRDRYFGALKQSDAGDTKPLAEFMLAQLSWSLDLALRSVQAGTHH
ncbi:Fic family protein [Candidatus Palauibacter sp.]|uniref:Fic family protein n=1 Tax=Candidatus Palauibacter sp. TaxID=3101350 RepID=UPI003B0144D9